MITLRTAIESVVKNIDARITVGLDKLQTGTKAERTALVDWIRALTVLRVEYLERERNGDIEGKRAAHVALNAELEKIRRVIVVSDKGADNSWISQATERGKRLSVTLAREIFTEAQQAVLDSETQKATAKK